MTPVHVVWIGDNRAVCRVLPNASVLWASIARSPRVNARNNQQSVFRSNSALLVITFDQFLKKVKRSMLWK
jgi:hypothetical protein